MASKAGGSLLLLLLSGLLVSSLSVPFNSVLKSGDYHQIGEIDTRNICAQTCNELKNQKVYYEPGNTYSYRVRLDTQVPNQESIDIETVADISVHAPCELVLRLRDTKVHGIENRDMIVELEAEPLHFAYEAGQVVDVCASLNEPQWTINLKKSIISALQMSAPEVTEKISVLETDINGKCQTVYEPLKRSGDEVVIRKVKQLNQCDQRRQYSFGFFPRAYGIDQVFESALVHASYECKQTINQRVVTEAKCVDRQRMLPMTGLEVVSTIRAELIDQQEKLHVSPLREMKQHHLIYTDESMQEKSYSLYDIQKLLQEICDKVHREVEIEVPQMFAELVQAKQWASVEDEIELWKSIRSGKLCTSPKLIDIYLDASVTAGSEGSIAVLATAYRQGQITGDRVAHLFSMLSQHSKQASVEAAYRLVELMKQIETVEKPAETRAIFLGITGYIHNLRMKQTRKTYDEERKIDQLIQEVHRLLINKLDQCIEEPKPHTEMHSHCLTVAYSLKNVGLRSLERSPIVARLIEILRTGSEEKKQYTNEIRVAIVRALVEIADKEEIRRSLLDLFRSERESTEIKIEAYRSVMISGAVTATELREIKQHLDQLEQSSPSDKELELINYVRSHQANLRKTADHHRMELLPAGAPVFDKPRQQLFGVSRNFELSYLNDVFDLGITAEADVIYEKDESRRHTKPLVTLPESIALNITAPVMGRDVQLYEIRIHQKGLEPVLIRKLRQLTRQSARSVDMWSMVKQLFDLIIADDQENDIFAQNPDLQLLIQIGRGGKTIMLFDQNDFARRSSINKNLLAELMETLHKRVSIDRAVAVIPQDFVVRLPTVNGMPIQFRFNSSVVIGLKSEFNFDARDLSNSVLEFAIWPSVASQIEVTTEIFAHQQRKSIKSVGRFYSAPAINFQLQMSKGRIVSVKFNMPDQKYVLARFENRLLLDQQDKHLNSKLMNVVGSYERSKRVCTDFTRKPLGVAFCYELEYDNAYDYSTEITIEKVDRQLTGYEVYAEIPVSVDQIFAQRSLRHQKRASQLRSWANGELSPIKFVFNTPGSQVDREVVFELEFPRVAEENKEIRLRIQSPWKQIVAEASLRQKEQERVVALQLTVDQRRMFQMELALEQLTRGQKIEYRPRMILALPYKAEPIHLAGVLSYLRDHKSVIHVELQDVQQKRNYIKGTVIKVANGVDYRASADLQVDVFDYATKLAAAFERSDRGLKVDIDADYRTPMTSERENVKLVLKLQNLSSGKLFKISNIGVAQFSQFPKYNAQFSHQLMIGANEYLEHDLKMGWKGEEEQVRLYQMVKLTGQRGKYDIEGHSIVVYRPAEIDYEIRANSALIGLGSSGQKRYNVVVDGRDRTKSSEGFRAEFDYSHLSKSPLKMKLRAAIKSEKIDFIYSDEIEEKNDSTYQGHLLVQLSPKLRHSADYVYQIKPQQRAGQYHHELDIALKNELTGRTRRHHSLLKMTAGRMLHFQSKLSDHEDKDWLDGEIELQHEGQSHVYFNHHPRQIHAKLHLNPKANPVTCELEFQKAALKHESSFEYAPKQWTKLVSKTKRDNDDLFTIEGKLVPKQLARVEVYSKPFEGKAHYELKPAEREAYFQFELPKSWSHESKWSLKPRDDLMMLKSATKYRDSEIADIEAKYHPESEHYFRFNSPLVRTHIRAETDKYNERQALKKLDLLLESGRFKHENKFNIEPKTKDFDFWSKTMNGDRKLADLHYRLADKLHRIEFDSDDLVKAKAECNLARENRKPFANIDFELINHDGEKIQHQSQVVGERDVRSIRFDSETSKADRKLAQIKANLNKDWDKKSYASVRIGDHIESNLEFEPYRSAKVSVNCPHYEHQTIVNVEKARNGEWLLPSWKLASSTVDSKTADRYQIDCEHQNGKRSLFKIDVPHFDSHFQYDYPSIDSAVDDEHRVEFEFNGKRLRPDLRHLSKVSYRRHPAPVAMLDSVTTGRDGRNYLKLNGVYRHQDQHTPSTFDMWLGEVLRGELSFNPYNADTKTLMVKGELKKVHGPITKAAYQHQTKIQFKPATSELFVDSDTVDKLAGKSLGKLDTQLTTDLGMW